MAEDDDNEITPRVTREMMGSACFVERIPFILHDILCSSRSEVFLHFAQVAVQNS